MEFLSYVKASRDFGGKIARELENELCAWETILCAQEGMSLQAVFEKPLPKLYVFFERNQEKLMALQKANLTAIASSAQANKDAEWNFCCNFMQRVVLQGKLPENLKNELFAWKVQCSLKTLCYLLSEKVSDNVLCSLTSFSKRIFTQFGVPVGSVCFFLSKLLPPGCAGDYVIKQTNAYERYILLYL